LAKQQAAIAELEKQQRTRQFFDASFRCTDPGECWIAVPLTVGRIALYRLPYDQPPKSLTHP
jgi:hypothetical protein